MWSSEASLRSVLLALAVVSAAALSGCSGLSPVYGDHGLAAERLSLRYAKPVSRLDQLIYEDLKLRLGEAQDPASPLVTVLTSVGSRDLTRSRAARVEEQHEAVVTAELSVTDASGTLLLQAERSASASYTTDGQGLADSEAERAAGEQAAKSLAETLRLTLLGSPALR